MRGDEEEIMNAFRSTRDTIRAQIVSFLKGASADLKELVRIDHEHLVVLLQFFRSEDDHLSRKAVKG